ncbi:MAG: undecaprenyldiphospho-muramoylpentapeptide beta-N-acetylglucosaminyltransferase [Candidatus Paceibacterota bacterium]
MKILFTGGGTGGHIFPLIAITREIKKTHPSDAEFSYMGPRDGFASKALFEEGIKTYFILSGKARRYLTPVSILQNIFDIFIKIPLGTIQAFLILFFTAPDIIVSKGGYGSVPAVIAGWVLQIPIFLHESDSVPGLANRLLGKLSRMIFVSFPINQTESFPLKKMVFTGNPIREELLEVNVNETRQILKLTTGKPIITILGGSQGSTRINDLVLEILPQLLTNFELIHQTGQKDFENIKDESVALVPEELRSGYHIYPFLEENEFKHALAAAKCVVARAGAGTIAEIAAFGRASILIPLPEAAQNHQAKNAYAYAKTGACIVIEEGNLKPNFFLEKLIDLVKFGDLNAMARAAVNWSRPEAAKVIAQTLLQFLN